MIYYFTSTHNSSYVAKCIAYAIGDKTSSILEVTNKEIDLSNEKYLIIVSPTYFWGLPLPVSNFLQNTKFKNFTGKAIFIATYGTTPGQIGRFAETLLFNSNGYKFYSKYSIKMPDNYTILFDVSNKKKMQLLCDIADDALRVIIKFIKNDKQGDYIESKSIRFPFKLFNSIYTKGSKTNKFKVSEACNGCGLCESSCPSKAIKLENSKPVWIKTNCYKCLGCLHHCPNFAISCGDKTSKHGQYDHKMYERKE